MKKNKKKRDYREMLGVPIRGAPKLEKKPHKFVDFVKLYNDQKTKK